MVKSEGSISKSILQSGLQHARKCLVRQCSTWRSEYSEICVPELIVMRMSTTSNFSLCSMRFIYVLCTDALWVWLRMNLGTITDYPMSLYDHLPLILFVHLSHGLIFIATIIASVFLSSN